MSVERTFALVKTAAYRRGQHEMILQAAVNNGLVVIARKAFGTSIYQSDLALFERLYAAHKGREYYDDLIGSVAEFSLAVVLEGSFAVKKWRQMMGPTDPKVARTSAPQTLRALYGGICLPDNAVHGSDAVKSAAEEIAIFFPAIKH